MSREVEECKALGGGLAALESRKYKMAARKFTELGVELGNSYEEVISPQDVATYGGLCALASLDRKELKERVLDNITFRAALEARPHTPPLLTSTSAVCATETTL